MCIVSYTVVDTVGNEDLAGERTSKYKNHIGTFKEEQGILVLCYGTHSEADFGSKGLIIEDFL